MKDIALARYQSVCKSNDLIQKTRYTLNTQQYKIILYIISQIEKEDDDFKIYKFDIKNFCSLCGIKYHSKNYQNLKDSIKELRDKSFWIETPKKDMLVSWLDKVEIDKEENIVSMRLDDRLKPFLLEIKKNYTFYELGYVLLMKSKYSLRLYELLKSYAYLGSWEVPLEELKLKLDCANDYDRWDNLKKWVIDKAIVEINKYTDLQVDYTTSRIGKAIGVIHFTINRKAEGTLTLTEMCNDMDLDSNPLGKRLRETIK